MKKFYYKQPDMEKIISLYNKLLNDFNKVSYDEQLIIIEKINNIRDNFFSMYWISYINYLLDVNNNYWNEQEKFFAINDPIINNYRLKYYEEINKSKYKNKLIKILGNKVFEIASLETRLINDNINEYLKEEKELSNYYSKLISSQKVVFNGEEISLSMHNKNINSFSRSVRIKAQKVRKECFEKIEDEIDDILDKLIIVRNNIAKELGFNSYTDLSYIKMKRIGYGRKEVEIFRNEVIKYLVPYILKLKERQRKNLGVDILYYYDENVLFRDGNSIKKGDVKYDIESALKMFKEISPEIYKAFKMMIKEDLVDLESRKGKSGGGITTYIPNDKVPIFVTNFSNTNSDVKVLMHEFGHSFQLYSSRNLKYYENWWPTFDTCEIHSKAMELLTIPYMNYFFEYPEKNKYEQLTSILIEICYICLIDEFQHEIYDKKELTKLDRKKLFRKLEKKYMPWINYVDNDYLEKGNTFQKQTHIFCYPFYYIDYALSDIVALQFYSKSINNKKEMWNKYIKFCSEGGKYSFIEILKRNDLDSPFEKDTVKKIIDSLDL